MLQPTQAQTQTDANNLIAKLRAMQLRREIKLKRGDFDRTVLDVAFVLKSTGETWQLTGVNDSHGGLTLSKV
jgi:hypothetical protein